MTNALRILRYHRRAAVGDGGMTGAVRRWSDTMTDAGASVTIGFDEGSAPGAHGPARWTRIDHRQVGPFRIPTDIERPLKEADLLVLHSGWTAHNLHAAAVARSLGVPYLLEPRGAYDPHIVARRALLKRLWRVVGEHRLVDGAAAIHAFFEEERAHLDAIGFAGPTVIVPNGVDAPDAAPWSGTRGGYLLWLGRFDPEHKGLDLLVDAVATLPASERPMIRLHGGDWQGGKQRTMARIARQDLGRWLVVGEPVYGDEKRRLLLDASAFLYPSRWDACPNAVLESVSLGIPTLCTPYPLGTYLADRGGAVLAEASVPGLAAALVELRDDDRLARTGAAGAEVARRDLRWDSVASSWLGQVEGLLGAAITTGSRRGAAPGPAPTEGSISA